MKYFEDKRVYDILTSIDRKDFVVKGTEDEAYQSSTVKIGWNTTISSPKVHSLTLESLIQNLKPDGKVLDIGCGGGYFSSCLARALGGKGKVFSLDHI